LSVVDVLDAGVGAQLGRLEQAGETAVLTAQALMLDPQAAVPLEFQRLDLGLPRSRTMATAVKSTVVVAMTAPRSVAAPGRSPSAGLDCTTVRPRGQRMVSVHYFKLDLRGPDNVVAEIT